MCIHFLAPSVCALVGVNNNYFNYVYKETDVQGVSLVCWFTCMFTALISSFRHFHFSYEETDRQGLSQVDSLSGIESPWNWFVTVCIWLQLCETPELHFQLQNNLWTL